MNSYNLNTLLKVRQHNRDLAEQSFEIACRKLEDEQKKLKALENKLIEKRQNRSLMHDHFFEKSKNNPSNKLEVNCLIFSAQKKIYDEEMLRVLMINKINDVKKALAEKEQALERALEANRDLKVIDKHYLLWQQKEKKCEALKIEYENDDQNGARFFLSKRV